MTLAITSQTLRNVLSTIFTPHKSLYSEDVTNRAAVVKPLISRQQTFDIAATVWLRTRADDGNTANEEKREEEALFSDIIFRGVHLSDRNLHTTVNFTMPTNVFQYANLTNYDLRGSVVLIPSSPSLLDYATNYSSYIPDSLEVLPVRAWPFPLGSHSVQKKTLADEILESFAVSIPLIQFHGIQSQCSFTPPKHIPVKTSDVHEGHDDDEEEFAQLAKPAASRATPKTRVTVQGHGSSLEQTSGEDLSYNHPYIVTRTQIRAIDEDGIFDRTAVFKAHQRLKATSCAQDVLHQPDQYSCKGNYFHNGNWETILQLRVPDESTGEFHKGWAYAPYFYLSRYGFGQKDLLAVPVQRETCTESDPSLSSKAVIERDMIDVSWKVTYIGRSPAKMALLDILEMPQWYSFDTTNEDVIYEHRTSELKHIYYWHRRTSTVSISIVGTTLIAAANILGTMNTIIPTLASQHYTAAYWISMIFASSLHILVLPLCQLKAVYRIDINLSPGHWIPTLRQSEASHLERVSYYFLQLQKSAVIPAATMSPESKNPMVQFLPDYLFDSMDVVGQILGIILNWQSQSFGGKTRASAILTVILQAMRLAWYVPALVGKFDTRGALYAHDVLMIAIDTVIVWQALTLPAAREISYEDHSE
ncbi:hypothetical protein H0H92_015575 [Tricholoma furcatifolium]|nr:hypothetical protein H0H92_015575 [Tricholoma furcatifolium]